MMSFDPNAASCENSGIFGLPHSPEEAQVVLIPVPFDATTSYGGGTAQGPEAIFHASKQVDLYCIDTGKPYASGIAMLPVPNTVQELNTTASACAAAAREGDVSALNKVNTCSHAMNTWVYATAQHWLAQKRVVGLVGGDHSTPFGSIQAHLERWPNMGVLHIDAHADLRNAYEGFTYSHASIMHNVVTQLGVSKLVQVGIRDFCEDEMDMIQQSQGRIVTYFDQPLQQRRMQGETLHNLWQEVVQHLPQQVYVSFDIDGLDPALCPSTGTPVPGGLQFAEAVALLATLVQSGRSLVGFDLNEVAPSPNSEWDANVGARMLYKLCGFALKSRE
jgi:agmatinase